jgi:hypothetical protein
MSGGMASFSRTPITMNHGMVVMGCANGGSLDDDDACIACSPDVFPAVDIQITLAGSGHRDAVTYFPLSKLLGFYLLSCANGRAATLTSNSIFGRTLI